MNFQQSPQHRKSTGASMAIITDFDRNVFTEVGSNSFLNFESSEADRLREIAQELRKIVADAKKRLSTSPAR
jgi:hypothetical protein